MSPEVEAQKVIAISLGKIASSRIQRGGPKLCKNLLVANLIHKARSFVDDQLYCYYTSNEQVFLPQPKTDGSDSTFNTTVVDESAPDMTEVSCENDETASGASAPLLEDYQAKELRRLITSTLNECDDKENASPDMTLDSISEISRNQTSFRTRSDPSLVSKPCCVPSRCLKRRNSCSERKVDYEMHRSPSKRVCEQRYQRRATTEIADISVYPSQDCSDSDSEFPVDSMDVEQISTLVSAFSNSFKDFSSVSGTSSDSDNVFSSDKSTQSSLWRSNSVPDMVFCAQQATSVLKMRQQTFETSTPVVA